MERFSEKKLLEVAEIQLPTTSFNIFFKDLPTEDLFIIFPGLRWAAAGCGKSFQEEDVFERSELSLGLVVRRKTIGTLRAKLTAGRGQSSCLSTTPAPATRPRG